jgi:hypothetical protein
MIIKIYSNIFVIIIRGGYYHNTSKGNKANIQIKTYKFLCKPSIILIFKNVASKLLENELNHIIFIILSLYNIKLIIIYIIIIYIIIIYNYIFFIYN